MKYIDEFRDGELAKNLAQSIAATVQAGRRYSFMEFCGGHTHAISRYGLSELLPPTVRMVHGPGCPVCVLPIGRVDLAIRLALERGVILCTYGDTLRVPASDGLSLMKAKARGGDIRMVYSTIDALQIARDNPGREVVFFAIGFETTTPPTAVAIQQADAEGLENFSVLCCHVLTPSAISNILESPEVRQWGTVPLDGFIGPAHVSTVIGSRPYEFFAEEYRKPVVIAGFEPLDVMQAILMLVRQVNEGRAEVENEFARAVTRDGNLKAQDRVAEVSSCAANSNGVACRWCRIRRCASARNTPHWMPSAASGSTTNRCRTTRRASAVRSCAASSGHRTARFSARCVRRRTRSVPAW
jgi:hydrogenase expression/formation protein HypD